MMSEGSADLSPSVLWAGWYDAARTAVISDMLGALYQSLDDAIAVREPTCWASGKCCDFDAYGHRLYVTGLEIAWVVQQLAAHGHDAKAITVDLRGACALQIDGKCSVHPIRPLGCRIYFCQEGTEAWQQRIYEQFQSLLRTFHQTHGLAYRYMEWRVGLAEGLANRAES